MVMNQMKTVMTLGAAIACGMAVGDPFPNQVKWDTSVTDGYIDDVENWKGATVLPGEGDTQTFDLSGVKTDVTVRVGPGTNVEQKAHFYVVSQPSDITFAFDTTGGRYLQAAADYFSNWQGAGFYKSGTSHYCNFENLNTTGGAPIFSLEDGRIVSEYADDRLTVRLVKGLWNCYDPIPGGTLAQNDLMVGGGEEASQTILEGGRFKGLKVTVRGGRLRVTGGEHEARGVVTLGSAYKRNVRFEIAGGSFGATNAINVGGHADLLSSTLDVSGTGHLKSSSAIYVGQFASSANRNPLVIFRDQATGDLTTLSVGQAQAVSNARFVMTNEARVSVGGYMYVGYDAGSTGTVEVADHADLTTYGVRVGNQSGRLGAHMHVTDDATWRPQNEVYVGGGDADRTATLLLDGRGKILTDAGFTVYAEGGGRFTVADEARIAATNVVLKTYYSTNALVELKGGVTDWRSIVVEGKASDGDRAATNVVRISGGTHRGIMGSVANYVGLTVGSAGCNALFEMTGGSFTAPRIMRVGYFATGSGLAVLRMRGGLLEVSRSTDGCSSLNICDSKQSKGVLELLGGTVKAQQIRGWTGALCKGGEGRASVYADGGTVASSAPVSTTPFFETFDEAVLGERGLTIDTTEVGAVVNQAFTDAASDVTGRVIKVGGYALTVQANSTHAETAVADGTLTFASATTQFGRSLVVTNGATLSLAGDATALTVERLVLGDAATDGFLNLDADDAITITGTDGLKIGSGYVVGGAVGTTIGVQTILRLAPGASVSETELAKLRVKGGSADCDYAFECADDGAGGKIIRMRTSERQTTTGTWTGRSSAAWATAENWSGNAVPDDYTVATFPSEASRRTVSVTGAAVAHGLVFDASYDLTGDGSVSLRSLAANAGTSTVSVALAADASVTATLAADAALTLAGSLAPTSDYMSFTKDGSGLLELSGASPLWSGNWIFSDGLTRATGARALGPETVTGETPTLTLGPATLAFAGAAQTYERPTTIAAGAGRGAVLRAEGDATLKGLFLATSGGLVKTGVGTLTIDGSGSLANVLAVDHMGGKANVDPDNVAPVIPADGSGPEGSGLGGFTVMEGTMRLVGNGAANTLFTQAQYLLIGARYAVRANPVLEVSNCTLTEGCAGEHLLIGGTMPYDTAATAPTLRILDGGVVNADTVRMGDRGHVTGVGTLTHETPTLAMTNGTLNVSYILKVGSAADAYITSRMALGSASAVTVKGAGGFTLKYQCDIEIADGSSLSVVNASSGGVCFDNEASGSVRLLRGGRITALKLSSTSYHGSNRPFAMTFDGGILELTGDGLMSVVYGAKDYKLDMTGAGGTFIVSGSKSHRLCLPVTGSGPLVKAGTGELAFGPGCQIVVGGAVEAADFAPLQLTGAVRVEEGTLALEAGGATNTLAVSVASGALAKLGGDMTLGNLSGAGTFRGTNETALALSCALDADAIASAGVPIFENVALGPVKVNLAADGVTRKPGDRVTVATLGAGATANLGAWKARGAGSGLAADLTREGNDIVATVRASGFILLFR